MPKNLANLDTEFNIKSLIVNHSELDSKLDQIIRKCTDGSNVCTTISSRALLYKNWLKKDLPVYDPDSEVEDKFSGLIQLARNFEETSNFFLNDVGVNSSTVWRWATGASRPSKYLAKYLINDLINIINDTIDADIHKIVNDESSYEATANIYR